MEELSRSFPDPLMIGSQRSRGFQVFLRDIGTAVTKHEEDKAVSKEVVALKKCMGTSRLSSKRIRELLIRLIYCEMLGHDSSFGYIHAIKCAEQSSVLDKKTGYLAASLFLDKNHALVCLLINTIQKDLKGTNVVAKSTVLNVVCSLVDAEKIPPLIPLIVAALKDERGEIRKKALVTLKYVHQLMGDDLNVNIEEQLRSAISDKDPIVVSAALQFFHPLIKANPSKYRGYLKTFLQVLKQIVEGKLPEFAFRKVEAPWIQIKLLNILALLGQQNKSCSEIMSQTLLSMMKSLPTDSTIGCAVLFECIRTVTAIYPLKPLLDVAARKTTLFLTSNSSNLKCLGITAMTSLVEINTDYAGDKRLQQVIINCLDEDDKTIAKKILELLYKITNNENICVICERLLEHIRSSTEESIRNEVARNLAQLVNRYAPNVTWYVNTINDVIQAADNFVQSDVMRNLVQVIAAAEIEDQRMIAFQYYKLLRKTSLHDSLVQIACWVIGEYGHLIQDKNALDILSSQLTSLLDRKFEDNTTYGWIMTALGKLMRNMGVYTPDAKRVMDQYRTGATAELRQRCHEIDVLASDMPLMQSVFSSASVQDDTKVCSSLSFLDNYVARSLTAGAKPYQAQFNSSSQETFESKKASHELRFTPYEDPLGQLAVSLKTEISKKQPQSPEETPSSASLVEETERPVKQPVSRPTWGPSGYSGNRIRKSSETSDRAAPQSSSASPDRGQQPKRSSDEGRANRRSEKSVKDTKKSKDSSPISADQSAKLSLFAGIKSMTEVETYKKVRTASQNDRESTSHSGGLVQGTRRVPQTLVKNELGEGETVLCSDESEVLKLRELNLDGGESKTKSMNESDVLLLGDIGDPTQESLRSKVEDEQSLTSPTDSSEQFYQAEVEKKDLLKERCLSHDNASDLLLGSIEVDESRGTLQPLIVEKNNETQQKQATAIDSILDTEDDESSNMAGPSKAIDSIVLRQDDGTMELCTDSNVRLVWCTVHRNSELILLMKLTNHNQGRVAIDRITLKFEAPSNLIVDPSQTEVEVEKLGFLETVTKEISMKYQYPATRMFFKGMLKYSVSQNSKVLYFEQELPARSLFQPLLLSTEEFGTKWTSTSCDLRKHIVMTSQRSCDKVVEIISKYIHFQAIDIKGSEGILAATVMGNGACLVHLNISKMNVEIWVKSSSKKLSEVIMTECLSAFDKLNTTE